MIQETTTVRLDKWLWAARFFKTRSLAKAAIEGGKVQYNGQRSKPGHDVHIGAHITVRQGVEVIEALVTALSEHRGNAKAAALLYTETEQSIAKRMMLRERRKIETSIAPLKRPDKRERREIEKLKRQLEE